MIAAMMVPSLAPTVALYTTMTRRRGPGRALLFTTGYLLVWGTAGLAAYGLFELGRSIFGGDLAWHGGGRWFAGGVLAAAAVYELTPLKNVCLAKCRSPVGFLLGTWRDGRIGALEMGSRHAGWCLGCCWALMGALFALGVMSLTLDGGGRGADRTREDASLTPCRDLGHIGHPARARSRCRGHATRSPGARRPERVAEGHADEDNAVARGRVVPLVGDATP